MTSNAPDAPPLPDPAPPAPPAAGRRRLLTAVWHRVSGIVRDTGWTGAKEVITLVTGLVTLNVLIIGLGPASYGRYVAISAFAGVLMTLSSVWVVLLLMQRTLQGGERLRDAYARSLGLACTASLLALGFGCLVGPLLVPGLSLRVVAAFVAAELCAGILFQVSAAAVQIERGIPAATRVRMLQILTRFGVIVTVGLIGLSSLDLLAMSLLAGYGGVGLVVFGWTVVRLGLRPLPGRPRFLDVREGLPYAGVLASLAVQEDSDKVFLVRLVDPVDAGLYAAAYKVVQLGFIPIRALMSSTHPRFLVNTPGRTNEHLGRTVRYTLPTAAYGLVATAGLILLAPVVPKVFGSEYDGTLPLLVALAPLILLRSLSLFPLNALLGLGRYTLRFFTIFSCTVLNVALNALLIPVLGVPGAVVSTIVTEVVFIVVAWGCVVVAQRRHDRGGGQVPLRRSGRAKAPRRPAAGR